MHGTTAPPSAPTLPVRNFKSEDEGATEVCGPTVGGSAPLTRLLVRRQAHVSGGDNVEGAAL